MKIADLRKRSGLTQQQLAELAGVSVRTIQRIENGHNPGLKTIKAVADALQVDPGKINPGATTEETHLEERSVTRYSETGTIMNILRPLVITGFALALIAATYITYTNDRKTKSLEQRVATLVELAQETNSALLRVLEQQAELETSLAQFESQAQIADSIQSQSGNVPVEPVEPGIDSANATFEPTPVSVNENAEATGSEFATRNAALLFNAEGGLRQLEALQEENLDFFLDVLANELARQEDLGNEPTNLIDQIQHHLEALLNARDAVLDRMEESQLTLISQYIVISYKEFGTRIPEAFENSIDPRIQIRIEQIIPTLERRSVDRRVI